MTHPDNPLASALRGLADQAAPPRLRIEAAWRTGRRRRWTAITGSVVGVAGAAAAAAVLVPLTLLSPPTHPAGPGFASTPRLHTIEFRQVARVTDKPCPPGSRGLPLLAQKQCIHLTHTGMRATRATYVETQKSPAGGYEIFLHLLPPDRHRFAVLTRSLVGLPSPHCELAYIIRRVVVFDPTIESEISSGVIQIIVPTQAQAHEIQHLLGIHR